MNKILNQKLSKIKLQSLANPCFIIHEAFADNMDW